MSKPADDPPRRHLKQAIKIVGGQSALARACDVKQGHVWNWLNKSGKCPAEHVLGVEEATGGKVARHQLRPDLYPAPGSDGVATKAKRRKRSGGRKTGVKIAIFGAGAIGGYLGVGLSLAGNDVTLIARGPHLEAMRTKGLKLLIDDEERVAKDCLCTDDPEEAGPQDYVIVGLKAHQAYDAAERLLPLLGPETPVVTAMNGVPWWYFHKLKGKFENHRLESVDPGGWQWKTIGPERAIGCVVYPATEIVEPGVIRHISGHNFTPRLPSG